MLEKSGFEGRWKVTARVGTLPFPEPETSIVITAGRGRSPKLHIDLGSQKLTGVYRKEQDAVTGSYGKHGTFSLSLRREDDRRRIICHVAPHDPRPVNSKDPHMESDTWVADEDGT